MKQLLKTAWAQLCAWVMRHALLVLAACLLVLFVVVVLSGKKSQDAKDAAVQAVTTGTLTSKQVKRAEKALTQKADSIQKQTALIKKVVRTRDSLVVKARQHDARADSLLKHVSHEILADPAFTPERVAQLLTGYKPKAWAVGKDSLR